MIHQSWSKNLLITREIKNKNSLKNEKYSLNHTKILEQLKKTNIKFESPIFLER